MAEEAERCTIVSRKIEDRNGATPAGRCRAPCGHFATFAHGFVASAADVQAAFAARGHMG
jgi:hypothetical protein